MSPLPSRSTIYRVLVRHGLVPARKRKRRRQASRFRPSPPEAGQELSLWAPADLEPLTTTPPAAGDTAAGAQPASWPDAIEVDRVVPPSGNLWAGGQQFWLSPARAGQTVTLWVDTTRVHLSVGGWRIKTVPSRLAEMDLARLWTPIPRGAA